MALEQLYLRAHWGPRKETVDECASRATECLRQLAACDEVFAPPHWFKCGRSLKQSLANKVSATVETLRALFEKGRQRRADGSLMEDLGFSMGRLWNGSQDAAAHVSFSCGAWATMPAPNDCAIDLPDEGSAAERVLRPDKLRQVMAAVVGSWDPDMAWMSSDKMWYAAYPPEYEGRKVFGWLTYVSDRYGSLPALPDQYSVERIEGLGNLIVIKDVDRLTASNPAHVEAVRRLSEILRRAGTLSPVPPSSPPTM